MENFLPDWNFDSDFPDSRQKISIGQENELSELLWKDGQLILQSQTHRKPVDSAKIDKQSDKINNRDSRSDFLGDEETVSWIQYPLEDDPFEKDFSSNFFSGFPSFDPIEPDRSKTEQQPRTPKNPQTPKIDIQANNNMPPPRSNHCQESKATGISRRRESSVTTVGPSHCGSNQFTNTATGLSNGSTLKRDGKDVSKKRKDDYETLDPNSTSCSGGSSGCSFGRTSKEAGSGFSGRDNKRKCTETEESESQSKSVQRSGSNRRRRAAEVHNLSERRRRDRINEKMKALQELIPHCSKTDKASVLDEAIDYLKSLQLQLQVMWMGSGMAAAPMMFPAVQPYMSRIPMPRLPMLDQSANQIPGLVCQNPGSVCPNPGFNPINQYQNPMHNPALSEQFARYIGGFHQMQAASQPINMFGFGSQTAAQQSQSCGPAKGVNGPNPGGSANHNVPSSS